MTTAQKIVLGLAAVALVVAGFALGRVSSGSSVFGAISNNVDHLIQGSTWLTGRVYFGSSQQTSISGSGLLTVGANGSSVTQLQKGTCSLIAGAYSVAASTTVAMDCAVTGVQSGDVVFGMFATSTATGQGWEVVQASASSTSGYITFEITNSTGKVAIIPASLASSTQYLVIR